MNGNNKNNKYFTLSIIQDASIHEKTKTPKELFVHEMEFVLDSVKKDKSLIYLF